MVDTKLFFADKQTALILIDLQRGVVVQEAKPHTVSDVVANSSKLVKAFRKAGLPVVFVRVLIGDREDILKPLLDTPGSTAIAHTPVHRIRPGAWRNGTRYRRYQAQPQCVLRNRS